MIKAVIEPPGILLMSLGKLPRMTLMPVRKRTKDYHDHHSKHFKVPKDHTGCRVNGMCYGRYVETFWPSFLSVELTIYFLSRLIVIFVFSFSPKLSTRSQIVIDALKIAGNDSMYIFIYIYLRAAAPAADPGKECGTNNIKHLFVKRLKRPWIKQYQTPVCWSRSFSKGSSGRSGWFSRAHTVNVEAPFLVCVFVLFVLIATAFVA